MSRMRGQVGSSTEGSRARQVFDRATATPLQIHAKYSAIKDGGRILEKALDKLHRREMQEGSWKEETEFLKKKEFDISLVPPQVADMGRWKEEVEKFIVSRYHQGYLWLDQPIEITGGLLYRILGIPRTGAKVPKSANTNDWMQFLTGSVTTKNSKGLLINKITNLRACWTAIIIYLCFTPAGRASDIKMTMVEAIAQVY
jgi:hypothetical protein